MSGRLPIREPGAPVRPLRFSALDPLAQRGLGQVKVAGGGADRLALIEN
jgi:hypothetical protein